MVDRSLGAAFKLAREGVKLPDVTVNLDGYSWKVHGELLAAQPGFFRALLRGHQFGGPATPLATTDMTRTRPRGRSLCTRMILGQRPVSFSTCTCLNTTFMGAIIPR